MGVLEAGVGETEVVEPMLERGAGNRDAESVMSVDNPIPPGSWCWRKIISRSSPLRARHDRTRRSSVRRIAGAEIGMTPHDLLEDRHRAKPRRRHQHRHDLRLEHVSEGVGVAPEAPP